MTDNVFWTVPDEIEFVDMGDDITDITDPLPADDMFPDMPAWIERPVAGGPFVYWTDEDGNHHGAGVLTYDR